MLFNCMTNQQMHIYKYVQSHIFIPNQRVLSILWPSPARLITSMISVYRVSQEERTKLREGVPYVKLYRYNPKHLCPKLNGYWDNGQIKLWTSFGSTNDSCQLVNFIYTAREFGANSADTRLKCISLHMSGRQAGSQQAGWRHRSAFQCDV